MNQNVYLLSILEGIQQQKASQQSRNPTPWPSWLKCRLLDCQETNSAGVEGFCQAHSDNLLSWLGL